MLVQYKTELNALLKSDQIAKDLTLPTWQLVTLELAAGAKNQMDKLFLQKKILDQVIKPAELLLCQINQLTLATASDLGSELTFSVKTVKEVLAQFNPLRNVPRKLSPNAPVMDMTWQM